MKHNPFAKKALLFVCILILIVLTMMVLRMEKSPNNQNAQFSKDWNPLYLNMQVSDKISKEYMHEFNISRAAIGYIYSIPAFYHLKQRHAFLDNFAKYMGENVGNPFGKFLLLRQPVNPKMPDVMPNLDTLYGVTFLELGNTSFVLQVPEIPNRYYSFAFVDAYFYNFDYVGSRTDGQGGGNYLIVGPNWNGQMPDGIARVIKSPTNSINIYERIYFKNDADVPNVNKIQDTIKLTPTADFINPSETVKLPSIAPYLAQPVNTSDPFTVIALTNQYMGENYPPVSDKSLVEYFISTGIGPNAVIPTDPQGRSAIIQGILRAENYLSGLALNIGRVVNGWQIPPTVTGARGATDSVAIQAMMQLRSVGLNATDEAVYYTTYVDSKNQPLFGGQTYTIRFPKGELPPVQQDKFGFWSLTLYGRDTLKLVENPENKYTLRSGSDFVYNPDGSLTLYISPKAPNGLSANWLPSPDSGQFVLMMRAYVGGADIKNGSYAPPPVMLLK